MHSHSVTYTVFTRTVLCIDAYLPVVHWFLAVPLTSLHISIRKKHESFVPRTTLVKKCCTKRNRGRHFVATCPRFANRIRDYKCIYSFPCLFLVSIGDFSQSFVIFPRKYEEQEIWKVITSVCFVIKIFFKNF